MGVFLILILFAVVLIVIHPYFIRHDTLVSFTGGLGSGKTFLSVKTALVLYRKNLFRVKVYNFFHRKHKKELPRLYSNIPVKISRRKYAYRLKEEHLLLQERIPERSVVLLDEVDIFANQFQYNIPCIVNTKGGDIDGNFDEFCRLYRHYTKGGYLVLNTQATANENIVIRRRQNTIYTLFRFRMWGIPLILPRIFYTVRVRHMTLSDEVQTVEEGNAEDNYRIMFGFVPWYRTYDTHCYSERYNTVPAGKDELHSSLKVNRCLIAPRGSHPKLTSVSCASDEEPRCPIKRGDQLEHGEGDDAQPRST